MGMFLSLSAIALGMICLVLGVCRRGAADTPEITTKENTELWAFGHGLQTVHVLDWPEFHAIVTHGGRDAFTGAWADSERQAEVFGLDVWRQKGSFWTRHEGRLCRSEHPQG